MDRIDPAGEYLRIAERYRQMKDEELQVLMPQLSELTDSAQQALANEFRSRGLKVETENKNVAAPSAAIRRAAAFQRTSSNSADGQSPFGDLPQEDSEEEGDAYEEERKLVELTPVWSERDALKVQTLLDDAGIPFFIGPEKATSADQVTSDFSKGLSVRIMKIGMPWAIPIMQHYEPEDDPRPEPEEAEEAPVRCPKCQSTEVVFEGLENENPSEPEDATEKFKWTCDACGNQWEDDGTVKEA